MCGRSDAKRKTQNTNTPMDTYRSLCKLLAHTTQLRFHPLRIALAESNAGSSLIIVVSSSARCATLPAFAHASLVGFG